MLKIIYSEFLKLKHNKVLWLIILGALLPAFLGLASQSYVYKQTHILNWKGILDSNLLLMNLLMGPALISLFTGYLVSREYQNNTVNQLFTYPYSRFKFLAGKIIIMLPIIAIILILTYLFSIGFGLLLKHQPMTAKIFWHYAGIYLKMLPMHFAWVPIAVAVSIVGRNYIPAMALGVGAVVFNIIVVQSEYVIFFPYSAPIILSGAINLNGKADLNYTNGIVSLLLTFIIPLIFSMIYSTRSDVHSGS